MGKRRGQHVIGSLGLKASVPQERVQGVCLVDSLPLFKKSCRIPLFPLWTLAFHSVPFPHTNWRKESENSYRNQKLPSPWLHQNMWEYHSRQTSEWISAWLLQCWDNKAAVSSWRVRKSNSWDPSLETGELREWNRVSNLQSLEMVPLTCESKVPMQGRSCELARNVYLPQTKASILRELVVMSHLHWSKQLWGLQRMSCAHRPCGGSAPASYSNSSAVMYCPDINTSIFGVKTFPQNFEDHLCTSSSLWVSALAVRHAPRN